MATSTSKLVRFIENPCQAFHATKKENTKVEDNNNVVCSYILNLTKFYVVVIIWAKYVLDVYVSYARQFSYLNSHLEVPDELKPFYTPAAFEEAKVHFMFRTLIGLEAKYYRAIHLTVVYITNVYCTLWWVASNITKNILTRAIVFNMMTSLCQYKSGDIIYHINLIISSYSVSQGACRLCDWIKDIIRKGYMQISTVMFVEEVLLSVLLTIMTTPMCVVLFLSYRLYRTFFLPVVVEDSMSSYTKLGHGDLLTMVNKLCEKYNFTVRSVYVSQKMKDAHGVKIRGFNDKRYLVLGSKLIEGHNRNEVTTIYTKSEIAAAILRAHAEYELIVPPLDIIVEACHWVTIVIFALMLSFGFFGGSRLGFVPTTPKVISFAMSKHISIPVLLVVQVVKFNLLRQRQLKLDDSIAEVGFGEPLTAYIGKEARFTLKCPVEDPFYTMINSDHPTPIERIRNLKCRIEAPPQA